MLYAYLIMMRTQIQLPEEQYSLLREKAHRQRTSISNLIRRGVVWVLNEESRSSLDKKKRALLAAGRFQSQEKDVSEEHDRYLSEIYRK